MTEQDEAVRLRKVLMSEELFEALGADRVEWGEPDADGFYTPTLYAATPPPADPDPIWTDIYGDDTPPPAAPALDPVREHFEEWGVHMCDTAHLTGQQEDA